MPLQMEFFLGLHNDTKHSSISPAQSIYNHLSTILHPNHLPRNYFYTSSIPIYQNRGTCNPLLRPAAYCRTPADICAALVASSTNSSVSNSCAESKPIPKSSFCILVINAQSKEHHHPQYCNLDGSKLCGGLC